MVVCQGCGRMCGLDLCCPACAEFERSSFFCSQDCFATNWGEHSKLHAILKQQKRLQDQDKKEQKIRGINAASNALNAIQELFSTTTEQKVHKQPAAVMGTRENSSDDSTDFKGHTVNGIDKFIGVCFSKSKGTCVILIVLLLIVITMFAKINFLISELPAVQERVVANRITETLAVHGAVPGVMVSSISETNAISEVGDKSVPLLRGTPVVDDVVRLKAELEKYKALAAQQDVPSEAVLPDSTKESPVAVEGPGVVRREAVPSARILQQLIGQVRRES